MMMCSEAEEDVYEEYWWKGLVRKQILHWMRLILRWRPQRRQQNDAAGENGLKQQGSQRAEEHIREPLKIVPLAEYVEQPQGLVNPMNRAKSRWCRVVGV